MLIIYITDHKISGRRYSQTNQLPIDGGHSYHELFEQKIESVLQFYKSTSFFLIYILVLLARPKKKRKEKFHPGFSITSDISV